MAENQSDGTFSGDIQIIKSMFPLTIGMFIGVLGGIGLSTLDDNARVSTATHDVLNEKRLVRRIDTTAVKKRPIELPHNTVEKHHNQ